MNATTYLLLALVLTAAPATFGAIALIARLSVNRHADQVAAAIATTTAARAARKELTK